MTTKHTPTPWKFEKIENDEDQLYRVTANIKSENDHEFGWPDDNASSVFHDKHYYPAAPNQEDAAFIVRACNSHDDMVEFLRQFLDAVQDNYFIDPQAIDISKMCDTARKLLNNAGKS